MSSDGNRGVVGRQQGGVVVGRQQGGSTLFSFFWSKSKKSTRNSGETSLVLLYVYNRKFQKFSKILKKKKGQKKNPELFFFFKTGEYNGDPKNNLAESERPENRQNRPQKHWKQPKWALEGPKKALWGLFRPFKAPKRSGSR